MDATRDSTIPPLRGVIVSHVGVAVDVEMADGERRRVRVARKSGHVVGDEIEVYGEKLVRLPRVNELKRRSPNGGIHVVAANLDVLGIVVAVDPAPRPGLVDRASVASRMAGIQPFLVVNKIDLDPDREVIDDIVKLLGGELPVFCVSADEGDGIEELEAFLATRRRGALIGPSGVGKSSLLNRLVPGCDLLVRELSEATGSGRHTTTVSTLMRLPKGGELADTPGIREYGLVDVGPSDLAHYFPGFDAVTAPCRFRDCLHDDEPGCAIAEAVDRDEIAAERFVSYKTLLDEAKQNVSAAGPRRR